MKPVRVRDGRFVADQFTHEWLCDMWQMASGDECARQWERVAWMILGATDLAAGLHQHNEVPLLNAAYEQACARAHMAIATEQRMQARIRRRPAMISAELRARERAVSV